ncbi:MAG: hypothetical protein FJ130_01920 [Deltaproteobacteria bacterium]|nr:hypothetical protein [Deltaproteobacteria bacterium]
MDIEFHYYIVYIVALRAGYDPHDAYLIAFSSQHTDDNNKRYEIGEGTPDRYHNYISQTLNILKPAKDLLRIHPIFHFMPGTKDEVFVDSGRRRDGKLHLLNTLPKNQNACLLLREALSSKNLYRIGVASHMYSDTFAHQNFVGCNDSFNSMKGAVEKVIPNIGHADAKLNPDWPALLWKDQRLIPSHSKIDNRQRFLDAAVGLFKEYCGSRARTPSAQDVASLTKELSEAIGEADDTNRLTADRIGRYKALIGTHFIEYDQEAWFKEAIDRKMGFFKWVYSWKGDYKMSNWFQFQESVKVHQRLTIEKLSPAYEMMELVNF